MEYDRLKTYIDAIEVIEAQNTLLALRVSDYPNCKSDDRSKFHSSITKKAFPNQKKKIVSFDDIDKLFGGM